MAQEQESRSEEGFNLPTRSRKHADSVMHGQGENISRTEKGSEIVHGALHPVLEAVAGPSQGPYGAARPLSEFVSSSLLPIPGYPPLIFELEASAGHQIATTVSPLLGKDLLARRCKNIDALLESS